MSEASLLRRFLLGVSGQGFLRIVMALATVALVPAFIGAWGVKGYGQWIALTALSAYLSYSNFGLVTTSANEMIMAAGADDEARAQRCFQMSVNVTLYAVTPLLAGLLLLLAQLPISRWLHLDGIGESGASAVLAAMALQLWLQTLRGLYAAVLFTRHRYGFTYGVAGLSKLVEIAAVIILLLFFHGTPAMVATAMTVVASVDLLITALAARAKARWARIDLRLFDGGWLRRQSRPAIGFAVSNLATQGALIHGPRLALGALLGGEAVALFALYGTAMRLIDQLVLMIMLPMEVEIAHAAGAEDRAQTRHLIGVATQLCWLAFAAVACALMLFGPLVFRIWTHGQVSFSHGVMALYLLMAAGNQMGRVSGHALVSTNRLYGPSFTMLACSLCGVAIGTMLAWRWGFIGMVLGVTLGEVAIAVVAIRAMGRWLGVTSLHLMAEAGDLRRLEGARLWRSLTRRRS